MPPKKTAKKAPAKKKAKRKPKARPVWDTDIAPRHPWERQPRESIPAFAAFEVYLAMDKMERSVRKAGETIGKAYSLIGEWSSKHNWVKRARARDTDLSRKQRVVEDREIAKMHRRQAQHATAGQVAAFESIKPFLPTDTNPNPDKMRIRDATRLFDVMARIERTSRGEPESITENRTPGAPPEANVDDKRTMMLKLMEDPEAMKAMEVLSKTLGYDGSKTDD